MGRVYVEHPNGDKIFICASCLTPLTNSSDLLSTRFHGATGRAFFFKKAVNLLYRYVVR